MHETVKKKKLINLANFGDKVFAASSQCRAAMPSARGAHKTVGAERDPR